MTERQMLNYELLAEMLRRDNEPEAEPAHEDDTETDQGDDEQ